MALLTPREAEDAMLSRVSARVHGSPAGGRNGGYCRAEGAPSPGPPQFLDGRQKPLPGPAVQQIPCGTIQSDDQDLVRRAQRYRNLHRRDGALLADARSLVGLCLRYQLVARVLFACGASPEYLRNQTIIRGLRRHHDVRCLASSHQSYPLRFMSVMPRVLFARGGFDVYFAGFLGQPIAPLFRLRFARPVILDAFISVYDTLCLDRRRFRPGSVVGRVARWLDTSSMSWAAAVLTDTRQQADFLSKEFAIPRSKFVSIPVGVNEDLFYPRADAYTMQLESCTTQHSCRSMGRT